MIRTPVDDVLSHQAIATSTGLFLVNPFWLVPVVMGDDTVGGIARS